MKKIFCFCHVSLYLFFLQAGINLTENRQGESPLNKKQIYYAFTDNPAGADSLYHFILNEYGSDYK